MNSINIDEEKRKFSYKRLSSEDQNIPKTIKIMPSSKESNEEHNDFQKLAESIEEEKNLIKNTNEGVNEILTILSRELRYEIAKREGILKDLLVILDQFDIIYKYEKENGDIKRIEAMEMCNSEIENAISKIGLKKLASIGERCNCKYHNCMEVIEAQNKKDGEIVEIIKQGYSCENKVIRMAAVLAAKNNFEKEV